jgi:hypothetical protein
MTRRLAYLALALSASALTVATVFQAGFGAALAVVIFVRTTASSGGHIASARSAEVLRQGRPVTATRGRFVSRGPENRSSPLCFPGAASP